MGTAKKSSKVSFSGLLTLLTVAFALAPAFFIWVIYSRLMAYNLDLLYSTSTASIMQISEQVQDMSVAQAISALNMRLVGCEGEMATHVTRIDMLGLRRLDLNPWSQPVQETFRLLSHTNCFPSLRAYDFLEFTTFNGMHFPNGSMTGVRIWWWAYQAMGLNVATNALERTLYHSDLVMDVNRTSSRMGIYYPDQATGQALLTIADTTVPSQVYAVSRFPDGWGQDLTFSPYSGQLELLFTRHIQAQNDSWIQVIVGMNTQTMSQELRDSLVNPLDRLFFFFRQPHGHMIAASHGKYFSHSDVDARAVNPVTNPPQLHLYKLYTCINSTDVLISQACQRLMTRYGSWTSIPESREEMVLNGTKYWVVVGYSRTNLNCTVVLLKHRASIMGPIESGNDMVNKEVSSTRIVSWVIFAVVAFAAFVLPLTVGLWLGGRLSHIATCMDRIAGLNFQHPPLPVTVISELHRFQVSFSKMERGLEAFGKFVPSSVVSLLVSGTMEAHERMEPARLTIMFTDIEGFTAICEAIPPEALAEVCTEYFEVMCSHIVKENGTIDKFIGDCIMAMWNAPEPNATHEKDAITACLNMQAAVYGMHERWLSRGLPALRFRLGLNTGTCLVGNFGCSHRVSYTSLGDTVNLSARLEALNKKFGTTLLVSESTHEAARDLFHFRRLSKVTVPGKSQVVSVYEALAPAKLGHGHEEPPSPTVQSLSPASASSPSGRGLRVMDVEHTSTHGSIYEVMRDDAPCEVTDEVVYHWGVVGLPGLLARCQRYEDAYAHLLRGSLDAAVRALDEMARVRAGGWASADKASELLRQLCEQQKGKGKAAPWDGIFKFAEK